jgi:hypothetical protein
MVVAESIVQKVVRVTAACSQIRGSPRHGLALPRSWTGCLISTKIGSDLTRHRTAISATVSHNLARCIGYPPPATSFLEASHLPILTSSPRLL